MNLILIHSTSNSSFRLPPSDIARRDPQRGGDCRDDREDELQDQFPGFFLHSCFNLMEQYWILLIVR